MQHPRRTPTAILSSLLVLAACNPGPFEVQGGARQQTFLTEALLPPGAFSRPARAPTAPVEHGGLFYSAEVVATGTALEEGPMSLRIVAHVRNPTNSTVRLDVEGCTVWPEFRHAGSSGPPVWVPGSPSPPGASRGPGAEGCGQAPYSVDIAAGDTHSFHFLAHDAMLAHGVEDGRYDVTTLVRLPGHTLRLDAGTADVRLMVPNLAFHVSVDEQAGRPMTRVRVENRNTVPVKLEWGHCAVGFELHARSDRSDAPQPLERERICLGYLAMGAIQPGETLDAREFTYTAHGPRNPELHPGTYELVVTLRMNWRTYRFPMGTLVVR